MRGTRRTLAALAAVVTLGALALQAQAGTGPSVILVCSGTMHCPAVPRGTPVYRTIGEGVGHAKNGDWVLVWPGYYREAVTVLPSAQLTDGLHVRGMNRNGVVLDGSTQSGSGIHVQGVNDTWVENMTAQKYRVGSSNGFYWTGVDGYWGRYLTAYDNNDYGVYAYDSTSSGPTPSAFTNVYASWNTDSGIYIGGCRDCNAVVTNSRAYKNAIGYSGTNAGGELYLINSEWDHNASGVVPNSENGEPDMPQQGVTIAGNYIHDNNDADVPGSINGFTSIAPLGAGVDLAGGWDDVVRHNVIANQKHAGVLMHWFFTPVVNNQVLYNTFVHDGYSGTPGDADVSIDGSGIQNCVEKNTHPDGTAATTDPPNLMGLSDCGSDNPLRGSALGRGLYTPGDPIVSVMTALNAAGVTEPRDYTGPGPRPAALLTMPNPCAGVPANPWCRDGKPVVTPPGAPGR